jgi:hypothetical protein
MLNNSKRIWNDRGRMSKNHEDHNQHEGQANRVKAHNKKTDSPYWKRAHHDWRFRVAVALMFAAIFIYVVSGDLAFRPRNPAQQRLPITAEK